MENRGVDDVIAGIKENLWTGETLKILGERAINPVPVGALSDAGPNDHPRILLRIPVDLRSPSMDCARNVRHQRNFALRGPMNQVARFGVSNLALVPAPRPDCMKFIVRSARNEDIPHQLTLTLRLQ